MTIKHLGKKYYDPIECKQFGDCDEEHLSCVKQLEHLRNGEVLIQTDNGLKWVTREDGFDLGWGIPRFEFELGVNKDGIGMTEPDWVHVHPNCYGDEIKN